MHFRECVSQHPSLSRLYILSTGIATLEQLKKICDTIYLENDTIKSIKQETSKTNRFLERLNQITTICAHEIVFVLVSMAVFLIAGVISKNGFVQLWILSALISYTISNFLMQLMKKNWDRSGLLFKVPTHLTATVYVWLVLILSMLISLACFLMIVMAVNNQGVPIYFNLIGQENEPALNIAIAALIAGSLVGEMLRPELYKRFTRPSI